MAPSSSSRHQNAEGVIVPIVTPLTRSGEVDDAALSRVMAYVAAGGVGGMFLLGTTGEDPLLPVADRVRLVRFAVSARPDNVVLLAGITCNDLPTTVELGTLYLELGVDVLVARLPNYYPLTTDQQYRYFESLAAQLRGPLLLYNISSMTHMTIGLDVVERLSSLPSVIGVKDSDRDGDRLRALLSIASGRDGFAAFVGASALWASGLRQGADGIVPGIGNLAPALCRQLYQARSEPEGRQFREAGARLAELVEIVERSRSAGQTIAALKAGMGAFGLCGPTMLAPLTTLSADEQASVRQEVKLWSARAGVALQQRPGEFS